MTAERLAVDRAGGRIVWRHDGAEVSVAVADLADAALEPASGRVAALSGAGRGRLLLFEPDGAPAGAIDPPAGYQLSHLVAGVGGLSVVGRGEMVQDGWPDWHFLIDARAAQLRRAGPAY